MKHAVRCALLLGVVFLAGCGGTTVESPAGTPGPVVPAEGPDGPQPADPASEEPSAPPSFTPERVEARPGGAADFTTPTGRGRFEITEYAWHRQGASAGAVPPKNAYLVLTVTVRCGEGSCYLNPAALRVRGADEQATFTGGGDGFRPELTTGTLKKGGEASGKVVFDLGESPVTVEFLDEFDKVAGSVKLDA